MKILILLFSLVISQFSNANCIDVYQNELSKIWEEEKDSANLFETTYMTVIFSPLGIIFGEIAGPAVIVTSIGSGIHQSTQITKRKNYVDSLAKGLTLLLNAESGEGEVLDSFLAEVKNQVKAEEDKIIEILNNKNNLYDFCHEELMTYQEIKTETITELKRAI